MDSHKNPNPNDNESNEIFDPSLLMDFELSDYLALDHDCLKDFSSPNQQTVIPSAGNDSGAKSSGNKKIPTKERMKKNKRERVDRVAFRTKSDLEIMDDGYKWRKYGKKSVKNSPNPRNYYKCLTGGCNVKKRVERDSEDSSYVLTTYHGVHNHHTSAANSTITTNTNCGLYNHNHSFMPLIMGASSGDYHYQSFQLMQQQNHSSSNSSFSS